MKKYIDPYNLSVFPTAVFACDLVGFVPWAIRKITDANWNHVMECRQAGAFVSQNLMYAEIPFSTYMNCHHRLEFWTIKDMTDLEKLKWNASINYDLGQSWWRRFYDFLGVIGHLTGIRWLQAPLRNYCSERMGKRLNQVFDFDIRDNPHPEEIRQYLKHHPRGLYVGNWEFNEGTGENRIITGDITTGAFDD